MQQHTDTSDIRTMLIHIDHMRSRTKYIKHIKGWVDEFDLTGRLILWASKILLILQGTSASLTAYLVQHKSQNVDVDSRGRPCKERLLTVLCNDITPPQSRFNNFAVLTYDKKTQVEQTFKDQGLIDIYSKYLQNI